MQSARIAGYRTKQDLVYLTLKEFILSSVLRPGERLVIRDLAAKLGVSETPIRAAITRLSSEGLVEQASHFGAVVGSVSDEDIFEIHLLVGAIQGLAAARAAARATTVDKERMAAALARLEALPAIADFVEFADLNRLFHRAIAETSGSTRLLALVEHLLEKVNSARSIWANTAHREKASVEHRQIVDAICAGCADEAHAAEERHWHRAGLDFASEVESRRRALG